jgi:hypothetical protein
MYDDTILPTQKKVSKAFPKEKNSRSVEQTTCTPEEDQFD